jgi:hypothetical protein
MGTGGAAAQGAKAYEDYRRLLDNAASFDAVRVATPDHWHFHVCKALMKADKQIADKAAVEFHFPARGNLPPVALFRQGGGKLTHIGLTGVVGIRAGKSLDRGHREDGGQERPRGRPLRSYRIPDEMADLTLFQPGKPRQA